MVSHDNRNALNNEIWEIEDFVCKKDSASNHKWKRVNYLLATLQLNESEIFRMSDLKAPRFAKKNPNDMKFELISKFLEKFDLQFVNFGFICGIYEEVSPACVLVCT